MRTDYATIELDHGTDGVTVATLNRPEKLNAVDSRMHTELAALAADFDADPDARVLVLTGAGRAFCAGGDFSAGAPPSGGNMALEGQRIVDGMLECRKPLIAAVNGYAMGLGATVALLCDVVVAAASATFADTHVVMGIGAGDGGQLIWPLLMGVNRAKYFLMTGARLGAEEAERLGLVNFVVPDGEALGRAMEVASQLASGPQEAIRASKAAVNHWMRAQAAQIVPLSLALESATFASPDAREAQRAFVEKRPPRYS